MSYAALILKDSPEMVWALDETSGTTVYPFSFNSDTSYEGSYNATSSTYIRSGVPIVYAGKNSIQSSGYTADPLFSVPSLGKFSTQTRAKSYTLEFWFNISIFANALTPGPESRTGESKIVGISGESESGLYIRDLDYFIFKIGDTGYRIFESAVHVPSIDTPQHIMVVYTPYSMQLIVNGVEGNVARFSEEIFNPEEESRTIDFYHPAKISSSSADFNYVSYDTVAIYPNALSSSVAKRHYVYGLGYTVPKYIIKSLGGVSYETNMQFSTPLKQINYIDDNTWSNRFTYDNLIPTSDGLLTQRYNNQNLYISSTEQLDETDMIYELSGNEYIVFPENSYSYLEVNNYESITYGQTKTVQAKFSLLETASTDEQQLMYIGSKSTTNKYISVLRSAYEITVKHKDASGIEQEETYTATTDEFIVSVVKSGTDVIVTIIESNDDSSTYTFTDSTIFPLQDSFIRFGSKPVFVGNSIPVNLSTLEVGRFDGGVSQVDISTSESPISTFAGYPEKKISDLYQIYADSSTKRIKVATSGSFSMNIPLLDLIGLDKFDDMAEDIYIAPRVEIGSTSAEITYDLKSYVGETPVETTHMNDFDIRLLYVYNVTGIKTQELQYVVSGTIRSTDTDLTPGILRHFRIYTYPVLEDVSISEPYIEINDSVPGNNPRYYAGGASNLFFYMPEIERTTDMHRSFSTGIYVGEEEAVNQFVKIPFDVRTVSDTENTKIYVVMFTGRLANSGNQSLMELVSIDGITVDMTTPEPSGVELYINGQRYDSGETYDFNTWTHFAVKFTSGIDYQNDIFFGSTGTPWLVDNISVILNNISSTKINYLYGVYFGETAERVPDAQSDQLLNVLVSDSELSDGEFSYQPLIGQTAFLARSSCPTLATTTNMDLTEEVSPENTFRMTYGSNLNLLKVDGLEMVVGDLVLLKNQTTSTQNGIYEVMDRQSTYVLLEKQTSLSDGTVIFVKSGNENKNYYFLKDSNTYSKTITQKKVVSYNDVSASITATVRYGA